VVVRRTTDAAEWPLTDGTALDERPALSPDGTQVVFVSNRSGRHGLWQVATAGGEPTPLLPGHKAYRPWWSPDGTRIYFFLLGRDRHRIHSIGMEGGDPVPLASDDRGNTHGPYVDPGGGCVLAHSTRDADERPTAWWGLYEFPLDGGTARRLEPPGHVRGAHVTRARNGVTTFDVSRRVVAG
jgi:dipeptidyl aminopeptidase/acylaminoacyl peptidase